MDNLSPCLVDTVYPQKILPNNKKESSKKVQNEITMKNENIRVHLYIKTCNFFYFNILDPRSDDNYFQKSLKFHKKMT